MHLIKRRLYGISKDVIRQPVDVDRHVFIQAVSLGVFFGNSSDFFVGIEPKFRHFSHVLCLF
jgi:hypothetical protein